MKLHPDICRALERAEDFRYDGWKFLLEIREKRQREGKITQFRYQVPNYANKKLNHFFYVGVL